MTSELLQKLQQQVIVKSREDFYTYAKLMAPLILPEGFKDGRHIEIMCMELQKAFESIGSDKPARLNFELPPGGSKSTIISRLFPSWCYGKKPNLRGIGVGHGKEFAEDNYGRPIREILKMDIYQIIFPNTKLKEDVQAAGKWETTAGGTYYAAGAGGSIAGRRAHITWIDDLMSEQTANSPGERMKVCNWYEPGLQSRLLPGGVEILVGTRWNLDDIQGFLQKKYENTRNPFRTISIPAILTEEAVYLLKKDKYDTRFNVGESFWPEFQPTSWLLEKKQSLRPEVWSALYQQNPIPDEGGILKAENFRYWPYEEPPEDITFVLISMDTAFSTKTTADYSAFQCWGIFWRKEVSSDGEENMVPNMILLNCGKGRYEFPDLCKLAMELNYDFKPDILLIEKKASGQSLLQELARRNLPIAEYLPDKDKISRAHAAAPWLNMGRVWVPKREFSTDLITECANFPHANHDDQVDAFTMAVLYMRDAMKFDGQYEDGEEYYGQRKTYWNSLTNMV
jgi:predicted phage terminase large subunit-like protein